MDIIKNTARNIFFRLFEKFRPLYNNFRNDHVMLRELTRAPGFVTIGKGKITVELFPAITVQPKGRQAFQLFLDQNGGNDTTFNREKLNSGWPANKRMDLYLRLPQNILSLKVTSAD